MNDRFKFRAWNKENKIMHYNAECAYDSMGGTPPLMDDSFGGVLCNDDYVVEQCTGVTDKNGRLIYEGDILRATCTDGKHIDYPVGWWDGAFHLYYVDKSLIAETGTIQFCLRGLVSVKNCCYREIIGNIHEREGEDE